MRIVAVITKAESACTCAAAAIAASAALGDVQIEALHTVVDSNRVAAISRRLEQWRLREADRDGDQSLCAMRDNALRNWIGAVGGPAIEWPNLVKGADRSIRAAAAQASLIVLVRDEAMDVGDAAHVALFETRTPLLLVPDRWSPGHDRGFDHVAIDVKNDASERIAVAAARPWLKAATRITAILVDGTPETARPDRDALGGDVRMEWRTVVRRPGAELGTQIADEAASIGADLLVCGDYRHGSLIKWLIGDTTAGLITSSPIPVLLAR